MQGPGAGPSQQAYLTQRLSQLLTKAEDEMQALKDEYLSVEHILIAMVGEGGVFRQLGVTRDKVMAALQQVRGNQRVTSQDPESTYQALEKYGRDLTKLESQGKLDPVIGRDEEVRRVVQVLPRTKNNPPHRRARGRQDGIAKGCAAYLQGRRAREPKAEGITALDMGALIAGASSARFRES